jgi:tRNA threonylcarbamoyladenosine biosynthesis protein TsaE
MINKEEFISKNEDDTRRIASNLAKKTKHPAVIVIEGGLGAGKTRFTQGLLVGWGSKDKVKSPTYTIERQYTDEGQNTIHHLDLYRLKDDDSLMRETVSEIQSQHNETLVIEWPAQAGQLDLEDVITVTINANEDGQDPEKRIIQISQKNSQ